MQLRFIAKKEKTASKQFYLNQGRLVSATEYGICKAAAETIEVMGYVVIAEDGWLMKKYADGRIEKSLLLKL